MEPPARDNDALLTTASDLSRSHLRQEGPYVVVLTEDRFFEELEDMFQHAEHPHRRSWEAYLYRPWGYVFTSWGLTFSRPSTTLTCGAQFPFLFRMDGPKKKMMGYVYPDLVLILSKDKVGAVFLVVEIKALPRVDWNTSAGKERASRLLARATKQARTQAKLAFLQHKDQSSIQAFLACGVWWLAIRYSRSDILQTPAGPPQGGSTPRPSAPSRDQGTKRLRRSRRHKPNKKTKGTDFSRHAHDSDAGDDDSGPRWLPEQEPDPQSGSASDGDDERDEPHPSAHPAARNNPLRGKGKDRSVAQTTDSEYDEGRQAVYHVMQLGAGKKALNPWFKAFLASVIDSWPGISNDDFQRTWFDLTEEERKLDYRWELAGRPDDEGFATGFNLPEGKELPATTDDLSDGVDLLLQVDGSTNPIALNKDADTDLSSLTSPHLRLPDRFDFLSPEVLDELASALMDRMTMKQTEGFQPTDFTTPRSSTNRTSSTAVPTRPVQHTVHAADRQILPLPSSSSFNSDVPFPSSPSPHDRQRDRDGFAIPSLPPHHRIISAHGRSLDPTAHLPSSALRLASAQRSQPRQSAAHHAQPSSSEYDAFYRALRGSSSAAPQAHDAVAPRPSTDSPAGRGPEPAAGAHASLNRPRDRDPFAAASDIPARQRSPRVRAHSVAGVTHAHDFASDSEFTTPRASGSGSGTGSAAQRFHDELDLSSEASTSGGVGPRDARTPRQRMEPRLVAFPKSRRGEFSARSTSQVVEIPMRLGPSKNRRQREQEQAAAGSGSGDAPQRDEGDPKDGEPGGKGKGRAGP